MISLNYHRAVSVLKCVNEVLEVRPAPPPPPEEPVEEVWTHFQVGGDKRTDPGRSGGTAFPANAALLIGIQAVGSLHHVIIHARCLWLQRRRSLRTPSGTSAGRCAAGRPLPPRGARLL